MENSVRIKQQLMRTLGLEEATRHRQRIRRWPRVHSWTGFLCLVQKERAQQRHRQTTPRRHQVCIWMRALRRPQNELRKVRRTSLLYILLLSIISRGMVCDSSWVLSYVLALDGPFAAQSTLCECHPLERHTSTACTNSHEKAQYLVMGQCYDKSSQYHETLSHVQSDRALQLNSPKRSGVNRVQRLLL